MREQGVHTRLCAWIIFQIFLFAVFVGNRVVTADHNFIEGFAVPGEFPAQ